MRRDGGFELMDLNSTNGSYVDDRQIHGSAFVSAGSGRFANSRAAAQRPPLAARAFLSHFS